MASLVDDGQPPADIARLGWWQASILDPKLKMKLTCFPLPARIHIQATIRVMETTGPTQVASNCFVSPGRRLHLGSVWTKCQCKVPDLDSYMYSTIQWTGMYIATCAKNAHRYRVWKDRS